MPILKEFWAATLSAYSRKSGLKPQKGTEGFSHKKASHKRRRENEMKVRLMIVCVLCFVVAVMGQAPNEPVAPKKDAATGSGQVTNGPREMTAADVEAFLDGLVPLQIKEDDIAGVTI